MLSQLEGHKPQIITVEASVDSRGIGVTVKERAGIQVNATFGEIYKTEDSEELSKGPRRVGHLGGRDKIQILPKFAPDGSDLIPTSTHALCSSRIIVSLTDLP